MALNKPDPSQTRFVTQALLLEFKITRTIIEKSLRFIKDS
jgi:hypothetical protein